MGRTSALEARDRGFTARERLLAAAEFREVRQKGKRHASKGFVVHELRTEKGFARLGLSVSTRVGGAVRRNRVKRLLREFFRLNKHEFPPSSDILISARKGISVKGLGDVGKELGFLIKRG